MDIVKDTSINDNTETIEAKVITSLSELSIDYNKLKPKEKKHLINIENVLTNTEALYLQLIQSLKNNKPSISSVSEGAGISSRQTIYNNPVLKDYITSRIDEITKLDPTNEIEHLKDKIQDLKTKLNLMIDRDIDTEILRHNVKHLKKQLKDRENSIISLEEQSKEMNSEISSLKRELKSSSSSMDKSKTKNSSILTFEKNNKRKNRRD